jgi:hypothetical protein
MGYIGLLLNAPYKIDSMVWMRIGMMMYTCFLFLVLSLFKGGYMNQGAFMKKRVLKVRI